MSVTINGDFLRKVTGDQPVFGGGHRRKSVSEVVTGDLLNKVCDMARRDAEEGSSGEYVALLKDCARQVAPDKKKLLEKAYSSFKNDIQEYQKVHHPQTFLEYVLLTEGKLKDSHGVDNGSYKGNSGIFGENLDVYDENGELAVSYGTHSGVINHQTTPEKKVYEIMNKVYNEALQKRRGELKIEEILNKAGTLDVYA